MAVAKSTFVTTSAAPAPAVVRRSAPTHGADPCSGSAPRTRSATCVCHAKAQCSVRTRRTLCSQPKHGRLSIPPSCAREQDWPAVLICRAHAPCFSAGQVEVVHRSRRD